MTIQAVEGGAGCGKTYRLLAMSSERLVINPLMDRQRVLTLTFMHGSRRRLSQRLLTVVGVRSRAECCTTDASAWRIYRRWRGLAATLAIAPVIEGEFDAVCDAAGSVLEQPEVCAWVAASFQMVLVDEGQVHRTNAAGTLAAANAICGGSVPVNGTGFNILQLGVSIPLVATLLANAITWRQGGNVAVITPSLQRDFARSVVARVAQGPCGAGKMGLTTFNGRGMIGPKHKPSSPILTCKPKRPGMQLARRSAPWRELALRVPRCLGSKIRSMPAGATNSAVQRSRQSSHGMFCCGVSTVAASRTG